MALQMLGECTLLGVCFRHLNLRHFFRNDFGSSHLGTRIALSFRPNHFVPRNLYATSEGVFVLYSIFVYCFASFAMQVLCLHLKAVLVDLGVPIQPIVLQLTSSYDFVCVCSWDA